MTDEGQRLDAWARALLARLSPVARRRLMREIASELRRHQQHRIAQQRHPDGSAYVPRKKPGRSRRGNRREKKGRIQRRAMFVKLRTARFLKAQSDAHRLTVGMTGRTARLARVHHYGEADHVAPGGPIYRYPVRMLLGFTQQDRARLITQLLAYLEAAPS